MAQERVALSVGLLQKRLLILLSIVFAYGNTHVSSDGFSWSQGFPFVFDWNSDVLGPSNFSVWLLTSDVALTILVLAPILLLWHPRTAVATKTHTLSLMIFSVLYYWTNVDSWHSLPWMWNTGQRFTYGFPFAYEGVSNSVRWRADWAILANVVIGIFSYWALDRLFEKRRITQIETA